MVLAESVQINGEAILAFLIVIGALGISWMTTLTFGTRVVYRAALRSPSGTRDSGWLIPIVAFDAIIVLYEAGSAQRLTLLVLLPPILHTGAYLIGRSRPAP